MIRRRPHTSGPPPADPAVRLGITSCQRQPTASVHDATPITPAAVRRCADLTSCGAGAASSVVTARATTSIERSNGSTRSSVTTVRERSRQRDAPAVRPSAVRFRARTCSRASPLRGRSSSPIIGSRSALQARSRHRPLAPRDTATCGGSSTIIMRSLLRSTGIPDRERRPDPPQAGDCTLFGVPRLDSAAGGSCCSWPAAASSTADASATLSGRQLGPFRP